MLLLLRELPLLLPLFVIEADGIVRRQPPPGSVQNDLASLSWETQTLMEQTSSSGAGKGPALRAPEEATTRHHLVGNVDV